MTLPELVEKNVIEVIPDVPGTTFDFKGTYVDSEGTSHNVTVFDTDYFVKNIIQRFPHQKTMVSKENSSSYFKALFDTWKASRSELYFKMAYAFSLKYNPIENYSSYKSTDYGHTLERVYTADKVTRTYVNDNVQTTHTNDKDTTTYTNLKDETKNKRYGVNSTTAVGTDESENTRTGSFSVERSGSSDVKHTGGYNDEHTGSYKDTNDGEDIETQHGNIGVKTAMEMLQAEYNGMDMDLADRALREFLDRYTWYCEGVWV